MRRHSSHRTTSSAGAARIRPSSVELISRRQPSHRRWRSAAAPTPPNWARSFSYSASRSVGSGGRQRRSLGVKTLGLLVDRGELGVATAGLRLQVGVEQVALGHRRAQATLGDLEPLHDLDLDVLERGLPPGRARSARAGGSPDPSPTRPAPSRGAADRGPRGRGPARRLRRPSTARSPGRCTRSRPGPPRRRSPSVPRSSRAISAMLRAASGVDVPPGRAGRRRPGGRAAAPARSGRLSGRAPIGVDVLRPRVGDDARDADVHRSAVGRRGPSAADRPRPPAKATRSPSARRRSAPSAGASPRHRARPRRTRRGAAGLR